MLLVIATFALLILGGTVTSKGAGLAVPDWPTTFNYNMFLFPTDMWKGNIFWEHLHRLVASGVGLMTIVMTIWLWHTQGREISGGRPWLRQLGVATLILVIAQGVMGGLRVTQLSVAFAIFHGFTAQVFLCMTVLIAAATSRWWVAGQKTVDSGQPASDAVLELPSLLGRGRGGSGAQPELAHNHAAYPTLPQPLPKREGSQSQVFAPAALRRALIACYAFLIAGFIQLALGATVRHHGAGLAIPDFPLNYGGVVPPLTQPAIDDAMTRYAADPEDWASRPHENYKPFHVAIHLSHRLWAVVVLAVGAWLFVSLRRNLRGERKLTGPARSLASKLVFQVVLGASVIWTGRHPEVATAHQTLGAAILATAAMIVFRLHALGGRARLLPSRGEEKTQSNASPGNEGQFSVVRGSAGASPSQGASPSRLIVPVQGATA